MDKKGVSYCISCARAFRPASPDVLLCPDCGGPPEAAPPEPGSAGQTLLDADIPHSDSSHTLLDREPAPPPSSEPILEPSLARSFAEGDVPAEWQPGDTLLDTYTVTGLLGEGGMGKVYRVHHKSWNIDLAVKSPRPEFFQTQDQKDLFISEAETWVNLGLHPHIVSCYYVRNLGGIPRVFAELVEGGSLADWIEQRKITTVEQALDIAIQFAWGLAYAHQQGLVHRDVKPANVLMTPDSTVKVTDFGLAKAGRGMTPAYASPEQAEAQLKEIELTPQSDIWSWGLSVLEMFAGRAFWVRADMPDYAWGQVAPQALKAYLEDDVEDPAMVSMPDKLAVLLRICFQTDPAQRPAGLIGIADQLIEIYQELCNAEYSRTQPKTAELRADSLNNRALSLIDLDDTYTAREILDQALQIEPRHPQATYNRLLLQWRANEIKDEEVLHELRAVQKSHPEDWLPAYLLALIHLEMGQPDLAKKELDKISDENASLLEVQNLSTRVANSRDRRKRFLTTWKIEPGAASVCIFPDDKRVLTGSYYWEPGARNAGAFLFDLETGKQVGKLIGDQDRNTFYLSRDGKLALTSHDSGTFLWNVDNATELKKIDLYRCISMDISPDSSLMLFSYDNDAALFDLVSGKYLRRLSGHKNLVTAVTFLRNGQQAITGSWDENSMLWDTSTGNILRVFKGDDGSISSLAISQDERYLAFGTNFYNIHYWDIDTGERLKIITGHKGTVMSVRFSADNRQLISGSTDETIKIWELDSGKCVQTFRGHTDTVNALQISHDGQFIISVSEDGTLKKWLLGGAIHAQFVLSRVVSSQGQSSGQKNFDHLIHCSQQAIDQGDIIEAAIDLAKARNVPGYRRDDKAIRMWGQLYTWLPRTRLLDGWTARIIDCKNDIANSLAFTQNPARFLSGHESGKIILWDAVSGEQLRIYQGPKALVAGICPSQDGRNFLSGGGNDLLFWDLKSGECLRKIQATGRYVECLDLSWNARLAISGDNIYLLKVWDLRSGKLIREIPGHSGEVNQVRFLRNGSMAVSAGEVNINYTKDYSRTLILWDLATGQPIRFFHGHESGVHKIWVNPDHSTLVASIGSLLYFWDIQTGKLVKTLVISESGGLQLTQDGRLVSGYLDDERIGVWDMQTTSLVLSTQAHAQPVVAREISPDGRYLVTTDEEGKILITSLDWELESRPVVEWDPGARPFLERFLALRSTGSTAHPAIPAWTEAEFDGLISDLACAGYGWLRSEGVRRKLEEMAHERGGASQ